jgi:hypothetical protein
MRGFTNIISSLKSQYIEFLRSIDLSKRLVLALLSRTETNNEL